MGAGPILGDLGKAVGDYAAEKLGPTIQAIGKEGMNFLAPMKALAGKNESAQAILKQAGEAFPEAYERNYKKLNEPLMKMKAEVQQGSPEGRAVLKRSTTVGEAHDRFTALNHPAAAHTQQMLDNNIHPKTGVALNEDKTFDLLNVQNQQQAKLAARVEAFGPNMELLEPHFQDLYNSKNPVDHTLADTMKNAVSVMTHDRMSREGHADVSQTKYDLNAALRRTNKLNERMGLKDFQYPIGDENPTYSKTSTGERKVKGFLSSILAAGAAIPHSAMLITNLLSVAPPTALVRAFKTMGDKDFQDAYEASGVNAATDHSMFDAWFKGNTNPIGQLPIPGARTAGELFHSAFHMPGLNFVRRTQIYSGASVGYNTVHMMVDNLVKGKGNQDLAVRELTEMGLDPKRILARGGKLEDQEIQSAMFHYVNNKFNINRPGDRSMYSNANAFMRSASMFHNFLNFQHSFLYRELRKKVASKDFAGVAQYVGVLGILMPAVAPLLKSAETLFRTASPSQAVAGLKQDYTNLINPQKPEDRFSTYLEMLSYVGLQGVYGSYYRAAQGHRLEQAVTGPTLGVPVTALQDALLAIHSTKAGIHDVQPLERDLLELSAPVVGKWAAHQLVPTTKEQPPTTRAPRATRRRTKDVRTIGNIKY